ncbi:MAG: tol-pal system protein YbgF [Candidatus Accumulibacter cognatus]|uniref:Cell division coordinator CpoB n=2 Tax=Candidatus Accumulibacter cognatus TaxID=2954383 RepID=A0A080M710_9PROT|nr:MAG: tol-pal system protein YbgF [Candidatus Accumulibacter cognatus]
MSGMSRRRCSGRTHVLILTLLFGMPCAFGARYAHAGLFDDEEARRQIKDISIKTNERLDTFAKGQIELANQIQALREENSRLRGQVETLTYELDSARKRQQDFYVDLDGRLRKLEPQVAQSAEARSADDGKPPVDPPRKAVSDPAAETREYEAALNLFRANKLKEAAAAFESFTKAHPDSTLTPSAQYWLGNAHYSLRDCKKAIDAHRLVASKWPAHPKAPDALLNVATCQQELADAKSAKMTLDTLLAKYPDSTAATTARQRLKK